MTDPRSTPDFTGWASTIGSLPTAVLPPLTDPVIRGWLQLILLRQEELLVIMNSLARYQEALDRALATLPDDLAKSLIAAVRGEVSEGLARALIAGRQGACSLCAAAGGKGCESPTCRG